MDMDMQIDSVAEERNERERSGRGASMRILYSAMHHFNNMQRVRDEGERCHRFVNGEHWSDKIKYNGKWVSEREALLDQGYNPRTVNLVNRVVKNVMGVVLKNGNQPLAYSIDGAEQGVCDVVNKLCEASNTRNEMKLMLPQQFKQFLEFGMVISKQTFGFRDGKYGCWNVNIDPRNFFCDTGTQDIRGWDCNMVGMLHTISLDDVLASFATKKSAKAGREMHRMICESYGKCRDRRYVSNLFSEQFGRNRYNGVDFLFPKNGNLCRVIEIWTKETRARYYVHDTLDGSLHIIEEGEYGEFVEAENARRVQMARSAGVPQGDIEAAMAIADASDEDDVRGLSMPESCRLRVAEWHEDRFWYYRFLTPDGLVLDEGESPYMHKSHPFVYVFYPFVLGEVRSFVFDILEEQKNLNRDATMFVQIMKNSMKGFTVYDKNTLPEEDPDGEHLMEVLAQPGGSYGFNLKGGEQIQQKVTQLSSNNTNIGLMENMQMSQRNIEDVSGVNGALQGKPGYSTTSGSLYQQQTQNATSSLLDIIEAFYAFMIKNEYKHASNLLQAYDAGMVDKIAGKGSYELVAAYLDTMNSDTLELDFKMVESSSSAVYRQIIWDYAQAWLQSGFIDFKTYLHVCNLPVTDRLLVMLEEANAQFQKNGEEPLPTRMPQQNIQASIAGANALNGGANNAYNMMARTRPV